MDDIEKAIYSKLNFKNFSINLSFREVNRFKFQFPKFYLSLGCNGPEIDDEQRSKMLQIRKELISLNSIDLSIQHCWEMFKICIKIAQILPLSISKLIITDCTQIYFSCNLGISSRNQSPKYIMLLRLIKLSLPCFGNAHIFFR